MEEWPSGRRERSSHDGNNFRCEKRRKRKKSPPPLTHARAHEGERGREREGRGEMEEERERGRRVTKRGGEQRNRAHPRERGYMGERDREIHFHNFNF